MGRAGFNSTKYKIRAQEEGAQTQTGGHSCQHQGGKLITQKTNVQGKKRESFEGFIGRTRTMPFIYYTSEFFA